MSKKDKPGRRNVNLIKFSHEHHHGLVFCSRLQKVNQASDNILRSYVNEFWDYYLLEHFNNEEKLFLPLLDKNEITLQFIQEHKQIKKLVSNIKTSKKEIHNLALELASLLKAHIRFEERILFPYLEKELSFDELETIGKALEKIEISSHCFSHQFWKINN